GLEVERDAAGHGVLKNEAVFIPPVGQFGGFLDTVLVGVQCEQAQPGAELAEVLDAGADGLDVLVGGLGKLVSAEGVETGHDGEQKVSHVVAESGAEGADGGHALGEAQLPLALLEAAGLLPCLLGLAVKLDEDGDRGAKDLRDDGSEDVVDSAEAVAAAGVDLVHVDGGDEDDWGVGGALPRADEPGGLEAVYIGHADVEDDGGEI